MKTKAITLRLDLPASSGELLRGLDSLSEDHELAAAERRVSDARANLADVKTELDRLNAETRGLPDAITRGQAAASQLDLALVAQRRASALVPAAESALAVAEAERTRATAAAQERALRLVNERCAQLLKADAVLLAHLDAIDEWIRLMTFRLNSLCIDKSTGDSGKFDIRGRTGGFPERMITMIHFANRG